MFSLKIVSGQSDRSLFVESSLPVYQFKYYKPVGLNVDIQFTIESSPLVHHHVADTF